MTTESPVSILKVLVFPAPFTPSKPKHYRKDQMYVLFAFFTKSKLLFTIASRLNLKETSVIVKRRGYLSRRDANTQPVHCWLLFPLVNLGEFSQLQNV